MRYSVSMNNYRDNARVAMREQPNHSRYNIASSSCKSQIRYSVTRIIQVEAENTGRNKSVVDRYIGTLMQMTFARLSYPFHFQFVSGPSHPTCTKASLPSL